MTNNKIDYQALSNELDALLGELNSGELDIDTALKKHARGIEILDALEEYLKTAENKIKQVKTDK